MLSRDGKLPHEVVHFVMALALWVDEDHEEVRARLTGTFADWGGWDEYAGPGDDGGITQAHQRLGEEPMKEVFSQTAVPVGTVDMPGGAGAVAANLGLSPGYVLSLIV